MSILEDFRRTVSFPVIICRNAVTLGVVGNFMKAFSQCNTDYISYCDQDDIWSPEKLASYHDIINPETVSLVFHRSTIVDENLRLSGRFEPFNVGGGCYHFPHFPDSMWGFGHQMLFSKQVLYALNEIQRSESTVISSAGGNLDYALLLAAGMSGDIHFIDKELMRFRRHGKSVSPAGNAVTKTKLLGSFGARQENVCRMENLLREMIRGFSTGTFRPIEDRKVCNSYLEHITNLHKNYLQRMAIHGFCKRREKLLAFLDLCRADAYGSIHDNKLPPRQMLVDCMRCVF